MPLLNVALPLGVYSAEQRDAMAAALCEVMTRFQGNEPSKEVVWVMIQELKREAYQANLDFDPPYSTATLKDSHLRARGKLAGAARPRRA